MVEQDDAGRLARPYLAPVSPGFGLSPAGRNLLPTNVINSGLRLTADHRQPRYLIVSIAALIVSIVLRATVSGSGS